MTTLTALEIAAAVMFALYCVTALVGARIFGGLRAAVWFACSNLLRSAAYIVALIGGGRRFWTGSSLLLMVIGLAMMHRSFTEQLDRQRLLWRMQLVLVGFALLAVAITAPMTLFLPILTVIVSAIVGIQAALTASALFSFSGEGLETAGRFAGTAMLMYSLFYLLRVVVALRFGSAVYQAELERTTIVCVGGAIFSGAATTFGFGFIASGRQRVELLWRAQIDELTGLLNRWAFKRIAVKETLRSMRKQGRLAVLMMDLDGMKRVNDRLGHSCGDAVLQSVAACLQEALRDRDSVARMGGDEFCILLPDTDLPEAVIVAERLRTQIDLLDVRYRGETVKVRASFGVSSSDQCGWSWQKLVDESDAALYTAKRAGNVQVVAAPQAAPAEFEPEDALTTVTPRGERRRRT